MSYSKQICVIKNRFPKDYRVYVYSVENRYNQGKMNATYSDIVGGTSSTSSDWCFEGKDDSSKNHFVLTVSNNGITKYYQFYVVDTSTQRIMGVSSSLGANTMGFDSDNYPTFNLQCAFSSTRKTANKTSSYNCLGFACDSNQSATLYSLNNSTRLADGVTVNNLRYFKLLFTSMKGEQNNIADDDVGYSDDLQAFEEKIESTDYYNELTQETRTLTSITVDTKPAKTSYYIGDSLSLDGLVINLNYSDSTAEKVAYNDSKTAFSSSGFDSETAGDKTVNITYQGLTTSFSVNVIKKQETDGNFTVKIRNCENGVLYAKRNGADYTDETIASNLSNKSTLSIKYDDIFKAGTNNIYFVFYPDNDFIPSERPYGVITYVDASNNEQSFNLPFNEATITQSEIQTSVNTYYCDISVNTTRKTFAFGGYGVYYDTTLTSDTYKTALFNLFAGSSEDTSEYGLFNIYKTNINELKSLSKNRFKIRSSDYYYTEIDLSDYITSLIQYPFNIEATYEQALILGNVATQINSHIVDSVVLSNSFEIKINGHYKDTRDISDSNIQCNFPFVDMFEISSQYINSTIRAEYLTDILTNASVMNVYSDNILIFSTTCIIGFKLPYTFYNTPFNEITDNLRFKYQNCNITVTQKLNNSSRYSTLKKDILRNFNGYVQTNEHIEIDSSHMFGNEYNTLKQLLQAGVYIE